MYALAVDIGASSGRHILGHIENGKLVMQEIYRFPNGIKEKNGHLCWDTNTLFSEILKGMKVAKAMGICPDTMAIDCFGVDFALIDDDGNLVFDTVSYRDNRTQGLSLDTSKLIPDEVFYERTGLAPNDIRSVYQLLSIKNSGQDLDKATQFLQLPDYFNFLLTGVRANELTNSETTLLFNLKEKDFDREVLKKLGIPDKIFKKPLPPATVIGRLTPEIQKEVGFSCKVVLPASHDTISAMLVSPDDASVIISSGTWSMLAVYIDEPILTEESRKADLMNMYIDDGRYLYMKGIMGMWFIQSIKKNLEDRYSFAELSDMARSSDFSGRIDVNATEFASPENMIEAIKTYFIKKGEAAPDDICDVLACVYHSLAQNYADTIKEIERITEKTYQNITIIGGGSQDDFLN